MEVNLKTGEVRIGNRKYNLTPYETRALNCLNRNGVVTYAELYKAIYGVEVEDISYSETRRINVFVWRLKQKTKLNIITRNRYGYELGE